MPRHPWAKVYVDLRHHPKMYARPDAEKWLWVCLLLHAKEHCSDFTVRGLSAADMRGMFGIKASVKAVQAGLDYLASIGWAVPVEGGLFLAHMEERQRASGDTPEAHAARSAKYRERHARDGTDGLKVTSLSNHEVTSRDGSRSDTEEEEEEETEEEKQKKIAARSAAPLAPVQQIEPRLLEGWPPALLAQVKDALASTRKSGMISQGPWRAFLLRAVGFSPAIRQRAAETYLERNYASERKAEGYLLGIMRGENGHPQMPMRAMHRAAPSLQISEQSKNQAATPGRKFV